LVPKLEEGGLLRNLAGRERRAGQLDHGADQIIDARAFLAGTRPGGPVSAGE
jgi:hypothetical protein